MQRIAITGSSGYYASKLIAHIRAHAPDIRILGCDVAEPRPATAPDEFVRVDVRDPQLREALRNFAPDTIIHLAFVVNPTHDDREMRSVNIDGTRNVFEAVRSIRPARFQMASSATAYGPFPDNPVPVDESWLLRARENYRYAVDKVEIEREIAELARQLPEVAVSWTRPAIIYGPGVDNYLSKFILRLPLIVLMDGYDCPLQLVHEDDVAAATWRILETDGHGPYNVGPPDWVTLSEIGRSSGRRVIKLPFWMIRCVTTCWWAFRLPHFLFPVGLLYFLRYPWVAAPVRLEQELGFRFRYGSRETLHQLLQRDGQLAADALALEERAPVLADPTG